MIEALAGAFSGVVCALIAATFGYAYSRDRQFDFWIIIVGAFFGLFAVQFGATFLGWQEWVYVIGALALFEYGGRALYVRGKRGLEGRVRVEKGNVLTWALIVVCVVFVEWWLIAFFMWFLPFVHGPKFMVYEYEYGTLVFRWFATSVPQIERDAFISYLIFALPAVCVIVGSLIGFAISGLIRRVKGRRGA